jgi:electron transfer flavoprotein beta subunit
MKLLVPIQFVPDLVEELLVDEEGRRLDPTAVRWMLNEFDDHALEQAILLKEKYGGQVTVLAPDFEGVEDALYSAAAKGADRLVRLSFEHPKAGVNTHALARLFAGPIDRLQPDLVLTGVSAHNSLDGPLGSILAGVLELPYVGYVSGVKLAGDKATVTKDYPGGLKAEIEVGLPAVLGIQAAETPPRYVPIARVRQAMKTARIEEESGELDMAGGLETARLYPPATGARAEMIEGDVDQVAEKLIAILDEQGLL